MTNWKSQKVQMEIWSIGVILLGLVLSTVGLYYRGYIPPTPIVGIPFSLLGVITLVYALRKAETTKVGTEK